MHKTFLSLIILSTMVMSSLFGGTTGKIAGRITDAETGEGLPGVNVQVVGTTLGASTDIDGVYIILNVPPGLHTIEISFIGYQTVRVRDVRVNVDFTTRVNQELAPTTIEMGAIEVLGDRNPLVRQDLTNTQVAVTAEQIESLPVDQIRDIIALQAGIVEDNSGNLHIRGGRSNEIAFQVNGLSINNPFGNTQGVGLATNAVEEVSVSAGTFSAEYGNALSGVINFVTKDGGSDYHATLRAYTGDHFSDREEVFFNIDERDFFNNRRIEGTLSGPLPFFGDKVTFFASTVWQEDDGYLYGIRLYRPEDMLQVESQGFSVDPEGLSFRTAANGVVTASTGNDPGASGNDEVVPMVTSRGLNFTTKVTWKARDNLKATYDLILDDGERFSSSFFRRYRFTPDGRPKTISNNLSQSLGITHTLSKSTFYTLKVGYNFNKARTSVFEDPFDPGYLPVVESIDDEGNIKYTNDLSLLIIPQTDIQVGGMNLNHVTEQSEAYIGKLDAVSQVHPSHELKFGGEFAYFKLDLNQFELFFDQQQQRFIKPTAEAGRGFVNFQSYVREPIQGALYFLDKIELAKRFILNAGLRYEFWDTRAPYNPDLAGTVDEGVDREEFLQDAEPKHRLSPRLSLSFPITSRGIIRFSYGFFYQNPTYRNVFRNPRFEDFDFQFGAPSFGNPNLNPQRSIQYEMGLQQQFTEDLKMDLTVFYKDVNDLIQDRRVIAGEVAFSKEFNVITNISYANVKGFTLAFLKRRSPGSLFSATLDYTFQIGEGAFDDPLALAINTRTGRPAEQELVPLDFDRTHTVNATVTLSQGRSWMASVIGSIQSGTPYTPSLPSSISPVRFEVNSDRRPTLTNIDLKLQKFFQLSNVRLSLFMQVENLLDTRQERFIFTSTGSSLTSLEEVTNPTRFNQVRQAIRRQPENFFPLRFINDYYQREDFLGAPREIRWGMTFEF